MNSKLIPPPIGVPVDSSWIEETGQFAYEIMQLKREKSAKVAELKERGKELQIVCRKIQKAGGKTSKIDSDKIYIVKGSFESELYNPEIGNYSVEIDKRKYSFNPELADELEKIHNLTFGYYGTILTQLASRFEIICKTFWKTEKEKMTNDSRIQA